MPTMASVYDYTFQCTALEGALQGSTSHADRVLVTRWHGVEALSRPYRFEITLAVARADLALETLLDQTVTLTARVPGGDTRRWHGVITRAGEAGRDETHYYYQVVLEPRLARLRNMQWSDVYLKRDLADLIKQMLGHAGLTDTYSSEHSPYDYRIAATGLTRTQTEFTCQYEETCLDFLMRKLEYYGVYFWFEQGSDRESLVFANDVTQQPSAADTAVYYPRGHQDPDARHIAITRLDRRVGLLPRTVVLHGHQDYANTSVTLTSQAEVPLPQAEKGLGEIHSGDDHFEQVEGDTQISGATLARWRAEELACGRLRAEGLARTPAFVRMATPYAGGASTQGLSNAGTSMLIEVPGHLRMSAGGSDEVLAGFLSSVKSFAPGISGATTGGIVMTNFVGAKVENTAGVAVSNFLGVKAEMKESLNFDFNLSAKLAVDMSTSKVFTPFKKDKVEAAVSDVNVSATKVVESEKSVAATRNTLVGTWNTVATSEFELLSPNTAIGSPATAFMRLNVSGASLLGASLYFEAVTSTTIKSTALTTIEVGETTSLTMTPASATVQSTSVELHSLGDIEFVAVGNLYASGPLITFG